MATNLGPELLTKRETATGALVFGALFKDPLGAFPLLFFFMFLFMMYGMPVMTATVHLCQPMGLPSLTGPMSSVIEDSRRNTQPLAAWSPMTFNPIAEVLVIQASATL